MKIIVERGIAIVPTLFLAVDHHLSGLVVIPEAHMVMIKRISLGTGNRVGQIQAHRHIIGNQKLVHRQQETWCHSLHYHLAVLPKIKRSLVVYPAKHIHLVAHHTDTTFKIDVFHQVSNRIIRTIGFYAWVHCLFIGGIHQHLVLITAQNSLVKMVSLIKRHRIDGIFRTAQVDRVIVRQRDIYLILSYAETRPIGATAHAFPTIVIKIINAFRVFDDRLVLLRGQHQGTVDGQFKTFTGRETPQRIAQKPLGIALGR